MAPAGDTTLALKAGELTLKGEDFNIQDVKTDDYLLITAASETGTAYEVQSVKVAEKVTGEVTGYKLEDNITVDGHLRQERLLRARHHLHRGPGRRRGPG